MVMEGEDPVENSDRGCQVLYDVLQSARSGALHAQDYQQHAHSLLSGANKSSTSFIYFYYILIFEGKFLCISGTTNIYLIYHVAVACGVNTGKK